MIVADSSLYMPNPIYHQIAFAAILLGTTGRNVVLFSKMPPGHPGLAAVKKTLIWGVVVFASSFGIWNIDNIFCNELRQIRQFLGPLGFLLECKWLKWDICALS